MQPSNPKKGGILHNFLLTMMLNNSDYWSLTKLIWQLQNSETKEVQLDSILGVHAILSLWEGDGIGGLHNPVSDFHSSLSASKQSMK